MDLSPGYFVYGYFGITFDSVYVIDPEFVRFGRRSLSAPVSYTDGSDLVFYTDGSPVTYTDGGCTTPVSNTDGSPVLSDDLSTLHVRFDNLFDRHSSSKNMYSRHAYTHCTSHAAPHSTHICSCLEPFSQHLEHPFSCPGIDSRVFHDHVSAIDVKSEVKLRDVVFGESIFSKHNFPVAFASKIPDIRKATIAKRIKSMNVCTGVDGTVAKQELVGTGVDGTVAKQNSVGTGGALARQQQASRHGGQEANKADASNGGIGVLEQRKNGGVERRRRQSKCKEVVGGGLGVDSTADKGAGRKRVTF